METTLHRQLKQIYAGDGERTEVCLEGYRIDAVTQDQLVEIQLSSLAAIRRKIARLLDRHRVLVVKPIVVRKQLIKRRTEGGRVVNRRASPKRGTVLDLFGELVHFTDVFPHPQLEMQIVLVEIEEWRFPGHGRRRRHRDNDFVVEDQRLLDIQKVYRLNTATDLPRLLPVPLPATFNTLDLANALKVDRWIAQQVAYCFCKTGTSRTVGKTGNTLLYSFNAPARAAA